MKVLIGFFIIWLVCAGHIKTLLLSIALFWCVLLFGAVAITKKLS